MKFERHFGKKIPYVHCFTHRLHLIVIEIVKNQPECVDFFSLVKSLHDFLKKTKVRELYEGQSIPLLIDQRWSSHNRAANSIRKNYLQILNCLEITSDSLLVDGDDRLTAGGLHQKITQPVFRFLVNFVADLLGEIEPINKMLQSREISYSAAVPLIDSCVEKIKAMRTDEQFSKYAESGESLIEDGYEEVTVAVRRVIFNFCILYFCDIPFMYILLYNVYLCIVYSFLYTCLVNSSMFSKHNTFAKHSHLNYWTKSS